MRAWFRTSPCRGRYRATARRSGAQRVCKRFPEAPAGRLGGGQPLALHHHHHHQSAGCSPGGLAHRAPSPIPSEAQPSGWSASSLMQQSVFWPSTHVEPLGLQAPGQAPAELVAGGPSPTVLAATTSTEMSSVPALHRASSSIWMGVGMGMPAAVVVCGWGGREAGWVGGCARGCRWRPKGSGRHSAGTDLTGETQARHFPARASRRRTSSCVAFVTNTSFLKTLTA